MKKCFVVILLVMVCLSTFVMPVMASDTSDVESSYAKWDVFTDTTTGATFCFPNTWSFSSRGISGSKWRRITLEGPSGYQLIYTANPLPTTGIQMLEVTSVDQLYDRDDIWVIETDDNKVFLYSKSSPSSWTPVIGDKTDTWNPVAVGSEDVKFSFTTGDLGSATNRDVEIAKKILLSVFVD